MSEIQQTASVEEIFCEGLTAESTGRLREAIALYENAFNAGHLVAGYRLGISDGWGSGIMARKKALKWLQATSDQGHVIASALLARAAFRGELKGSRILGITLSVKSLAQLVRAVSNAPPGYVYKRIPQLRKW